jgi:membrane-bound lytic murein transglycosylase B
MRLNLLPLAVLLLSLAFPAYAGYDDRDEGEAFVRRMVSKHNFKAEEVRDVLDDAEEMDDILEAISRPAEGLPWHRYRAIFLRPDRIEGGARFKQQHAASLAAAEAKYGVPAEIIVAIIGVETLYGQKVGTYRVLDALATLGFDYPKRGDFFRSELENFLLMCREEKLDPRQPVGSYAGAMGLPQFMPSSFRAYAVDFNGNGKRDLWAEPEDVIGSVANYLAERGWKRGQLIAAQVVGDTDEAEDFKPSRLDPLHRYGEIVKAGVRTNSNLAAESDMPAGVLELEGEDDDEYWVALKNFFVITTYNRSPLYAMAVFQLSQAIRGAEAASDPSAS